MEPTHRTVVIPISGYAGAGKDTLARAIDSHLKDKVSLTLKFADVLKEAVDDALRFVALPEVAFTEDRSEKEKIRPLLVEFGRYCRSVDLSVFANVVARTIRSQAQHYDVIYITDLRYANELAALREICMFPESAKARDGFTLQPVYVETVGVCPANDEERRSIQDLLAIGGESFRRHVFNHGDFEAIDRAARGYEELVRYHLQ